MNILLQAKLKALAGLASTAEDFDGELAAQLKAVLAAHGHDPSIAKPSAVGDQDAALDVLEEIHGVVALQANGPAAALAGHLAGVLAEHDRHVAGEVDYLGTDADLVAVPVAETTPTPEASGTPMAADGVTPQMLAARDARIRELEQQLADQRRGAEAEATAARVELGEVTEQLEQATAAVAGEQRKVARAESRADALGEALAEAQAHIERLQQEVRSATRTQVARDINRQMEQLVDAVAGLA